MGQQPIPRVTPSDVERVVRRDFRAEEFHEVMSLLNEYGAEKWHHERPRVKLAALKLAGGDLKKLRLMMNIAKCDYRDVLAPAEYPGYMKKFSGARQPPVDQREQTIEDDWKQYESWLKKEN